MRSILDGSVYAVQLIEKDHDISLRVDKAQKNPISF